MSETERQLSEMRQEKLAEWKKMGKKGWLVIKNTDRADIPNDIPDHKKAWYERIEGMINGKTVFLEKTGPDTYQGEVDIPVELPEDPERPIWEEYDIDVIDLTPDEARKMFHMYRHLAVSDGVVNKLEGEARTSRERNAVLHDLLN